MLGAAMLTVICTGVYLGVALLCPRGHLGSKPAPRSRTPKHAAPAGSEAEWFEALTKEWVNGTEGWLKYAMIEDWPETTSWL